MGNASPGPAAFSTKPDIGNRRLQIALYATVAFLYWMALYLYAPTLPTYVQSKADRLAQVGTVLAMYGLWQALIRLPLGIASDWLGWRKPFIFCGFILAGLGAWTLGVANNIDGLLIGRSITGLAAGTWVPLIVVFSSLFPPHEAVRASAMLTFVGSVGRVLATGVTGSLNEFGGYSLAFFLAAGAAALAILMLLPAQEKRRPSKRPAVDQIGHLITRRDVLLPSLLSAVSQYANWAATFGFIPILAKQLGATDIVQSALVSMHVGVIIPGNLLTTFIASRLSPRLLVALSFGLLSFGVGGAAFAPSLPWLFVAQFCIGLSMGVGYPVLMGMSIRNVAETERTTAMGVHQAVYAFGMFGGPWLSGLLAEWAGIRPMFAITAVVCLSLGLFGARLLSQER